MRALILKAARELFARHGSEHVTMRQIAARIDYSPAAIYRYYKSKEDILFALRLKAFERFSQGQLTHEAEPDPVVRLRKLGRQYIHFALEQPDWFRLLFGSQEPVEAQAQKDLCQAGGQGQDLFRRTVAECQQAGVLGNADTEATVTALWSMVHGMACLALSGTMLCGAEDQDVLDLFDRMGPFVVREQSAYRGDDNDQS